MTSRDGETSRVRVCPPYYQHILLLLLLLLLLLHIFFLQNSLPSHFILSKYTPHLSLSFYGSFLPSSSSSSSCFLSFTHHSSLPASSLPSHIICFPPSHFLHSFLPSCQPHSLLPLVPSLPLSLLFFSLIFPSVYPLSLSPSLPPSLPPA